MKFTVIILTHNEKVHIERCILSVKDIASKVFIIDSFSDDDTVGIARRLGAEVLQHKWKNYADQFQWAIENCGMESDWLMRMDADEYLEPELIAEIKENLSAISSDVDGIYIRRKVFFMGQWIRHGGFYPHTLLRIWRTGRGRIEQRWMDEHIVLMPGGKSLMFDGHLVDDNQKGITFWINKHNNYATREMVDLLSSRYNLVVRDDTILNTETSQAKTKRFLKEKIYANLPVGFRALFYFFYRYFLCLGFLDGTKGFIWHFMQGFWYRLLVDIKIMEIERRCKGNVLLIKKILREEHGINL